MTTTPRQFRLAPATLAQLDQIALHLGQLAGRPVTRTAALRQIIEEAAKRVAKKTTRPPKGSD